MSPLLKVTNKYRKHFAFVLSASISHHDIMGKHLQKRRRKGKEDQWRRAKRDTRIRPPISYIRQPDWLIDHSGLRTLLSTFGINPLLYIFVANVLIASSWSCNTKGLLHYLLYFITILGKMLEALKLNCINK